MEGQVDYNDPRGMNEHDRITPPNERPRFGVYQSAEYVDVIDRETDDVMPVCVVRFSRVIGSPMARLLARHVCDLLMEREREGGRPC